MSAELAELVVVHPATGEVLDLTGPPEELAGWRLGLIDLKRELDHVAERIDVELSNRLDVENSRSGDVGPYHIETQAPTEIAWDTPELSIVLEALVNDGRLARGAATRALETVVTYKPHARELDKLLRHSDPEVAEMVGHCRVERPRARRRVTVTVNRRP